MIFPHFQNGIFFNRRVLFYGVGSDCHIWGSFLLTFALLLLTAALLPTKGCPSLRLFKTCSLLSCLYYCARCWSLDVGAADRRLLHNNVAASSSSALLYILTPPPTQPPLSPSHSHSPSPLLSHPENLSHSSHPTKTKIGLAGSVSHTRRNCANETAENVSYI